MREAARGRRAREGGTRACGQSSRSSDSIAAALDVGKQLARKSWMGCASCLTQRLMSVCAIVCDVGRSVLRGSTRFSKIESRMAWGRKGGGRWARLGRAGAARSGAVQAGANAGDGRLPRSARRYQAPTTYGARVEGWRWCARARSPAPHLRDGGVVFTELLEDGDEDAEHVVQVADFVLRPVRRRRGAVGAPYRPIERHAEQRACAAGGGRRRERGAPDAEEERIEELADEVVAVDVDEQDERVHARQPVGRRRLVRRTGRGWRGDKGDAARDGSRGRGVVHVGRCRCGPGGFAHRSRRWRWRACDGDAMSSTQRNCVMKSSKMSCADARRATPT